MTREELKELCDEYLKICLESDKVIKDKVIISELKNLSLYDENFKILKNIDIKKNFNLIVYSIDKEPVCECGNTLDFVTKDKASLYVTKFGGWRGFCSRLCMQKSKSTVEKRKNTNIERYGVDSYAKSDEFKEEFSVEWSQSKKDKYNEKRIETSILKYGVEHFSKTEDYLNSRTETCQKLYGVDNTFQLKEKVVNGQKLKFNGKVSWTQTEIGKDYLKNNNPMFNKEISIKSRNNRYKSDWNSAPKEFVDCILKNDKFSFELLMDDLFVQFNNDKKQISEYLQIGYSSLCRIIRNFGLKDKYVSPKGAPSFHEKEVLNYVRNLLPDEIVIHGDRSFLENCKELDILIPSKKLAIEFDGIYYHSEYSGDKDMSYHVEKTNICESKGVRLLHIFSTEWEDPIKQKIWKSIIKHKLGLITNKIYARKCIVQPISPIIAREFLNNNHLNGFVGAKYHKGLFYNDKLVSVISISNDRFGKSEKYEIIRFASLIDYCVVGGISKLLSSFDFDLPLTTFADRRISSVLDSCYKHLFATIEVTNPSFYVYHKSDYILYHRLSFTKQKLNDKIIYDNKKSYFDNLIDNGYDRIWDCGNLKFS